MSDSQMSFTLPEDHVALAALAEEIFTDQATTERVVEVERAEGGFDRRLWKLLADSGLLAACLPESAGGGDMGALGLVAIAEQQGRRVAPVPFWSVVAAGALPIAQFGSAALKDRLLERVLTGDALVTGAFDGLAGDIGVTGVLEGGDLVVDGAAVGVPAAAESEAVVVPVRLPDGASRVAVISTGADGVSLSATAATAQGSTATVHFAGVRVTAEDVLDGGGADVASWILQRARLTLCGVQLGTCAEGLATTAAYVSQREQFGRPISTNQAVAVRAADAHLDTEAIRLTTQRAAWLLDTGREQEAESAILVAKFWASRGGLRVVHATQHLHGGIGADIDYPIHRYFLWGRQAAFSLGGSDQLAAELGAVLESAPRIGAPA
ncbi:acyl-CoA dehydrogenase family protein [Nocardioides alcanivorans]|uniref:acyl-CoA dehydrogenase family protein n=1 Tax=Nocardioides alcanivorans TaxID=2897352 RepID=UPI001F3DC3E2|nr:acyl-CoA dehydrogenase family protein [Nocardioides alcanivorans]